MDIINIKDEKPEPNEYVFIHLNKDNWDDDPGGKHYWKVAKFVKGITKQDREKMKKGELPDETVIGLTCPTPPGDWVEHKNKRSSVIRGEDEWGNNTVGYRWEEFGPGSYFGQEVDFWCRIPTLNKRGYSPTR